ncbi:CDP-diacylglycerol diphosphatase [Gluconacetobacter diazotrophicus PA1 5]|uniref:CDP-diacylglycerol pyrophosphatase n=1 Tax=Gluconacetobacter diazotrophicus TaxID=33996 RepID=A0A7W4FEG1_GLUDI|nr:CDP-diacylglycerol diphosphatase [Gluconacetobacter diazotrophicus]ACI50028.1 CDP-diacylglycerol diphosphatase [Gluconacetobacter diazotrophicus PA1 5]MBB2156278.1 CDP-diacylglycerol diphosphatase [Gluconacetobacter diazotrophicus]TWB07892.1 CDP-diacylglycerol pyrophosphatase [Gluconacetobacter diazotrophicus]
MKRVLLGAAVPAMLAAGILLTVARASGPARLNNDPNVLWSIVHDRCVPNQVGENTPAPCAAVDTDRGYAVLKDRRGLAQYLVIATDRVTGIEDPSILSPAAPDYFGAAWHQVDRSLARLGHTMPRETMALAINSQYGRSQNQLHIHIDCLAPNIRVALHWARPQIGHGWTRLVLNDHTYRATRIDGNSLDGAYPFRRLAASLADPAREMGEHTLVVVGTVWPGGRPGFILLDDMVKPLSGDRAEGEELQDHACRIGHFEPGRAIQEQPYQQAMLPD